MSQITISSNQVVEYISWYQIGASAKWSRHLSWYKQLDVNLSNIAKKLKPKIMGGFIEENVSLRNFFLDGYCWDRRILTRGITGNCCLLLSIFEGVLCQCQPQVLLNL